jgi:hypothetical protein
MKNEFLLKSYYPVYIQSFKKEVYCSSRHRRIILNIKGKENRNENESLKFSGICGKYRGGMFFILETTEKEILLGWNDKFAIFNEIETMQWSQDFYSRKFVCRFRNSSDNLDFRYESIIKRWLDPLQLYENIFCPDIWENLVGDLPRDVFELYSKNDSKIAFSKMINKYINND